MKVWVPAALIAFGIGAALGWATRATVVLDEGTKPAGEKKAAPPASKFEIVGESRTSHPSVPRLMPSFLAGNGQDPVTPRHQALKAFLDVVPRAQLQDMLIHAIWGEPEMERKALAYFRRLESAQERDLFVDLKVLEFVSDPAVKMELAEWARGERDASQRRRLATIVGSIYQSQEFLPVVEELLYDSDIQVASSVLGRYTTIVWGMVDDDPARKLRWTQAIRSLAAPSRPKEVRLRAIRSLRGAKDETTAQFLMQAAAGDRDQEVVLAALSSLPEADDLSNGVAVEMIRMLYSIATDEARPPSVRSSAALAADMNDRYGEDKILTTAEQELIEKIRDSWSEE